MKRFTLACALGALVLAPAAGADIRVGVSDDHPKDAGVAARFYDTMKDVGMNENRITVLWDATRPTAIDERNGIEGAIDAATRDGVKVTLALYPGKAKSLADSSSKARFVAWTALVARAFPAVKDIIVGNEPNKSRFWQPQFVRGKGAACAAYEPVLAASYDALKAVNRSITVLGVGLGPRGTDNPRAPGNLSISPVRCIRDIGRAYRKSRRTKPIMDALSYHPYPNASTDKLETGYSWPNAGIPNLDRVKQAVWDAFHGTGQPTFPEAGTASGPARTLKLRMNEVGWQVAIPSALRSFYFGKESVVTTDEGTQAAVYGNMIPMLACDPAVESVLFFNLVDEANLDRWQSGLLRADWSKRPSYSIVKGAIQARLTHCNGPRVQWRHAVKPVGVHLGFLGGTRRRSEQNKYWSFVAGTDEGSLYTAGLFRVTRPGRVAPTLRAKISRSLRTGRVRGAALKTSGKLVGGWDKVISFRTRRLRPGFYVYGAQITAEMNLARKATYVGLPFAVGTPTVSRRSGS